MASIHFGIAFVAVVAAMALTQTAAAQDTTTQAASAFDGHWSVVLVCDDVTDRGTRIKGYTYAFPAEVKQGRLEGQYGTPDAPASLKFVGRIQEDGAAVITATGRAGNPEYAVGGVSRRASYVYKMRGSFNETSGNAERTERRPCKATFTKQ